MLHHNTSYLVLLAPEVDVTPRMSIARQLMEDPICRLPKFGLLGSRPGRSRTDLRLSGFPTRAYSCPRIFMRHHNV
jgi:hypothetical protein